MTETIIKKGTALTKQELDELDVVYRLTNAKMPENHIKINHIDKTDPTFYLYKAEGRIVAFQAYSVFNRHTPFARKAIPVVYLNLSYKDASADKYIKNFAKKSNQDFIKDTFGKYWYLKEFAMVFQTYNPNLMERISPYFGSAYPHPTQNTPAAVLHFAQDFFANELQLPHTRIGEQLVKEELYDEPSPITHEWPYAYRSKNENRNQFFISHGVINQQGDEYFLSGKAVFFIGHYRLWPIVKKTIKKRFAPA